MVLIDDSLIKPDKLEEEVAKYDEKEKKLNDIFKRINPSLCNILKGIIVVLSDTNNPDRLYQSSNSIRGISGILVRTITVGLKKSGRESELEEALNEIDKHTKKAIRVAPVCQSDESANRDALIKESEKFIKTIRGGMFTFREKLFSFYGGVGTALKKPKPIRTKIIENTRKWCKIHQEYFTTYSHYPEKEMDSSEFMEKWDEIKTCWINALSGIYDKELPLLDCALTYEEPPNE